MKKVLKTVLIVFLVLAVLLLVLQGMSGNGPLKKLNSVYAMISEGNKEEYSFAQIEKSKDPVLKEKKVAVLGSSVAFGAAADGNSIGEYLKQRFDVELYKEAVSSTTLADIMPWSYVRRIRKLNKDVDYDLFICQLSTNDATLKVKLGEISDGEDIDALDLKTASGALEYIILYARENFDCPIVFFTGSHFESDAYDAMVKRLYELKDKYEIGILDLWNDETFNTLREEDRNLYMKDKIHPTKAGYRDWWCPEMERQLLAYLKGE